LLYDDIYDDKKKEWRRTDGFEPLGLLGHPRYLNRKKDQVKLDPKL
jgi:hypothetical protein